MGFIFTHNPEGKSCMCFGSGLF